MKKVINVVAANIENNQQEILCALRSPDMSLSNLSEFPGGKVEENEDIYTALEREIEEELNCKIRAIDVWNENIHKYDTFIIHLISIKAKIIKGMPTAREQAKLIWLKRENLKSLKWAPTDISAVEQLIQEK